MLSELAHIHPDQWSKPFWDAAANHELVCQSCLSCGTQQMPPAPICYRCRLQTFEYKRLPGTGTIFTYSKAHHSSSADHVPKEELPYTVLVVDLDDAPGCRLIGALIPSDTEEPEINRAVRVAWEQTSDGASLPRFELI